MFFSSSRYAAQVPYTFTRGDGVVVAAVRPAPRGVASVLGYYRRGGGERLDHVAARFLADATQFWRLNDANDALSPDALAARDLTGVPIDAPRSG